MISENDTIEAIRRIAKTPEGGFLRLYLQRALMAQAPSLQDGALQRFEGERTFARKLIGFLDEGANPEPQSADRSDEPVNIPRREPVAGRRRLGLERRVQHNDPNPGDD